MPLDGETGKVCHVPEEETLHCKANLTPAGIPVPLWESSLMRLLPANRTPCFHESQSRTEGLGSLAGLVDPVAEAPSQPRQVPKLLASLALRQCSSRHQRWEMSGNTTWVSKYFCIVYILYIFVVKYYLSTDSIKDFF